MSRMSATIMSSTTPTLEPLILLFTAVAAAATTVMSSTTPTLEPLILLFAGIGAAAAATATEPAHRHVFSSSRRRTLPSTPESSNSPSARIWVYSRRRS
jgi:predicted metal-binding membrane protein